VIWQMSDPIVSAVLRVRERSQKEKKRADRFNQRGGVEDSTKEGDHAEIILDDCA
jgi:hypothetical protein